jgi:hypothetical protein
MGLNLVEQRQQAHSLLDVIPDKNLPAVYSLLEEMVGPLSRSLAMAPVEEENLTEETVAALERGVESLDAGRSISHEEILREFGR